MAFQKTKCDPVLGQQVHEHLVSLGLETPIVKSKLQRSSQEKIDIIESKMQEVMEALGLDLEDDSLIETPKRIAKMYVLEKFWGLHPEHFPKCTAVDNKMRYDEMVIERDIRVLSDCEHHFVQIDGYATVAYLPTNKVLGLSKMNRIVEYFSRRPQIQERLAQQVGEALKFILGTDDVAVSVIARHYCVIGRGVEDQSCDTVTNFLSGKFKENSEVRKEFLSTVKF